MSAQHYKPEQHRRRQGNVVDPDYNQRVAPNYDDTAQVSCDEGAQPDYDTDFVDTDAQEVVRNGTPLWPQ